MTKSLSENVMAKTLEEANEVFVDYHKTIDEIGDAYADYFAKSGKKAKVIINAYDPEHGINPQVGKDVFWEIVHFTIEADTATTVAWHLDGFNTIHLDSPKKFREHLLQLFSKSLPLVKEGDATYLIASWDGRWTETTAEDFNE